MSKSGNDGQVPAKRFNGGNKSRNDVFVGSSFSVLIAAIRRKDARNSVLLCDHFKRILGPVYMNPAWLPTRVRSPARVHPFPVKRL